MYIWEWHAIVVSGSSMVDPCIRTYGAIRGPSDGFGRCIAHYRGARVEHAEDIHPRSRRLRDLSHIARTPLLSSGDHLLSVCCFQQPNKMHPLCNGQPGVILASELLPR